jgi:predicted cobalt transporter CbtA
VPPATSAVAVLHHLKRGVQAGGVAGLAVGAFGYLLAEPVIDRAVQLQSARSDAEQARLEAAGQTVVHHADVFSRDTQHLGFLVAAVATGLAVGVLFAVLHAVLHPDDRPARDPWRSSLKLAAAGFFAIYLVPFLRYPPNPPGVGDPATIDTRSRAYMAALTIGIIGVVLALRLARDLASRGWAEPGRQLAVAGVLVATVVVTFVLPDNNDPLDVPAGLLWQFRLLAIASSALLWAGLGIVFGLLAARDRRSSVARSIEDRTPAVPV